MPFLVRTFLISRMVSVLSSISSASNSCLFLEFRNLISSVASVGLSPNSSLMISIAPLDFYTNSCFSKMICMDGHISDIDLLISMQMFFLALSKVFSMEISFLNCCTVD
jgi:hypothetical protein